MGAKKIISIVTISLLAIVVAVLSVYVVFFKEKENNLEYSQFEYNIEKDESSSSSQKNEEDKIKNLKTPSGD